MALIDIGDLQIDETNCTKQVALFDAIREKIVSQLWAKGLKLPSTRKLALELGISRNTVLHVYDQLLAEGYIESKAGAGNFVALELPDQFVGGQSSVQLNQHATTNIRVQSAFAPGVPDLSEFPTAKWQRILMRHSNRLSLLGSQDVQGDVNLRQALANYLASSRSVRCHPDQIVITSGAQQALAIATKLVLPNQDAMLMEQPGYTQMAKVLSLFNCPLNPVEVVEKRGLNLDKVEQSSASAIYVTPSNQYPMGTSLDINQRLRLIEWANRVNGTIIEDDYDSEFQFAHRPYPSLQGLAAKMGHEKHVVYVGSLSKVMFNGLRLGYLVLPDHRVSKALEIKDAISGDSPSHTQAALADFIQEGDLIRHIRKMRRLYKQKHQLMREAIAQYLGPEVEVISQAAGLHITIKWDSGISEHDLVSRAAQEGIAVRAMSYFEHTPCSERLWQGAILGFGNVALADIEPSMRKLAQLFKCGSK